MKRPLVISGLIVSALIVASLAAIYVFPHLLWIHYARYQFPKSDHVNQVLYYEGPVKRTPSSTLDKEIEGHESFTYGQLVFQTVWRKASKTKKLESAFGAERIYFTDKKWLQIAGTGEPFAELVLKEFKDDRIADVVFGAPGTRTNYSVHKQIFDISLEDTPENRAEMVRMMTLLLLKAVSYPVASTLDTFSFKTETIMGWQHGKPGEKNSVILSFYDRRDRQYEIIAHSMTQQEIDAIISSMSER